ERLCESMAAASDARTMRAFLAPLRGRIETAHVSDADGLLGEGLPYGEGAMDLDEAVDLLRPEARWIVSAGVGAAPERSGCLCAGWRRIAERRTRLVGLAA